MNGETKPNGRTDAQTRIKLTLGDMIIQLSAAHARIEELEEELAKLKPALEGQSR
jgi:hypothetical protein